MRSDCVGLTLGELISLVRGNTYKSVLLGQPGPVLLGLASIQRNGGFRDDSLKTYGGESADKLLLRAGDLYVSLKDVTQSGDLLGSVARVPKSVVLGRLTQDTVKLQFDPKRYPPDLLYWTLRCPEYRAYCRERAIGTTNLSLSRDDFLAFSLPAPTTERLELVALLETIEQRIELLRQTNATLESIAQALFKSWFIDFDPVRAKAEGREPEGMDAATAALFPAEFEESALGLIPKGWRVADICEVAEVRYGAPFASQLFNTDGEGLPLLRIRDLKDEAPGVWTPEVHQKGCKVYPGDIVVGMDGEFRAHLWGGEVAWMNQRICMFKPTNGHSAAFVKAAIAAPLAHVEATETATTVIHLGKGDIDRFRVVTPPPDLARAFGAICQPLLDRVVAGKQSIRSLASVRDTLLPRLISGKLRVPEAIDQLEKTAA